MSTSIRSEATYSVVTVNGVDVLYIYPSGLVESPLGKLPLTREYVSAQQTITSAGLLTLPHGLGLTPKRVEFDLVCAAAENGWSVGDRVLSVSPHQADSVANRSNAIYADSTNVYVRFTAAANCFTLANKSTGVNAALTNANWRLVVRALA